MRIFLLGNSQGIGLLGNRQESRAAANDERLGEGPQQTCPPGALFGGPLLKIGMSGRHRFSEQTNAGFRRLGPIRTHAPHSRYCTSSDGLVQYTPADVEDENYFRSDIFCPIRGTLLCRQQLPFLTLIRTTRPTRTSSPRKTGWLDSRATR